MYRIQVRRTNKTKPWYWRIIAGNGQVILTSETYSTKSNARRAATRFWSRIPGMGFTLEDDE